MFLTWDVGQHDDNEAVVVVKRHVILVRKPHGVHSSSAYKWQSSVNAQQFSNNSQGVKDDEEVVSGKEKEKDVFKSGSAIFTITQNYTHTVKRLETKDVNTFTYMVNQTQKTQGTVSRLRL